MDESRARRPAAPADHELTAEVRAPHRADSVRAVRAFLARLLDGWGLEDAVIDDAGLLASELMSNAVRQGSGIVELRVAVEAGRLHVAVHDDSDLPTTGRADPARNGGPGLWIVHCVARDWGTDQTEDEPGKTVWFELTTVQAPEGAPPTSGQSPEG